MKVKKSNFKQLKAEERRILKRLEETDMLDEEYDKYLSKLIKVRELIVKSTDSYSKRREIISTLVPAGISAAAFLLALFVEFSGDSMFTSTAAKTAFKNLTK